MKKYVCFLLAAMLLLTCFTGCKENPDTSSSDASSSDVESTPSPETFTKPEAYASVVLVTINPQFKLYLDAAGDVLAVEPVNTDAKQVAEKMTVKTGAIATVVDSLITVANNDGFVKKDVTVNIEVAEIRSEAVNTSTVLETLKNSVESEMQELDVQADIKTTVAENALVTTTVAATTTTMTATTTAATTTTTNAPTTAPNYTAVTQKNGYWKAMYLEKGTLQIVSLSLVEELSAGLALGDPLSGMPEEVREEMKPACTVFQDEYYYVGRGDGDDLESVAEDGITVTVKDLNGNTLTLTRISETELQVAATVPTFAVFESVPKGLVFTYHTPEA